MLLVNQDESGIQLPVTNRKNTIRPEPDDRNRNWKIQVEAEKAEAVQMQPPGNVPVLRYQKTRCPDFFKICLTPGTRIIFIP